MADARSRFVLRPVQPSDRAAIEAMHRRCSFTSRLRRWRAPLPDIPRRYLDDALAARAGHIALVAVDVRTARVVALGSAVSNGEGAWELGVLVADETQHLGLGTRLAAELTTIACHRGALLLRADLAAENRSLIEPLAQLGSLVHQRTSDGIVVTVDVSARTSETSPQRSPAPRARVVRCPRRTAASAVPSSGRTP